MRNRTWFVVLAVTVIVVIGAVVLLTRPTSGEQRRDDLIENLDS